MTELRIRYGDSFRSALHACLGHFRVQFYLPLWGIMVYCAVIYYKVARKLSSMAGCYLSFVFNHVLMEQDERSKRTPETLPSGHCYLFPKLI